MRRLFLGCIATSIAAAVLSVPALAADTIKIGVVNETTGPNAEAGVYTVNGARLALEEINKAGGILGKQVELLLEDNQSTNPGTVLAYSKLAGEGVPGVIGPIRSTQTQAISPSVAKAGIPTMFGGSDPSLTHTGNPWLFRCRPNDSFSSLVISDFGVNTLKLKKWAIVHSTDAFGTGGMNALVQALKAYDITPVLVQGYTNNSQDFTPIVLAIKKAGGILGKQVELLLEDNQSTNPGTVLAYSKLAGEGVPGVIGPIRSTQTQAISPSVAKAGIPTMFGGSDPSLTHTGNQWLFRCRPNDSFSSLVISDFGVNTLKLKKWAIVHSTDAFGTGGMNALVQALKAYDITPVLVQGYTNNSQDFTPIVLAIKKSGADVIGSYMTNSPDVGIFAKQLRQLGLTTTWIGSPSVITDTALKLAGPGLYGVYGIADFTPGASPEAKAYADKYRAKYNLEADVYSSWAYDAMHILAMAINQAKGTNPEAIRKAILATCGYNGVEGTYCFDENGDGLRSYNVVKNDNGKVVFIKHIDNPKK